MAVKISLSSEEESERLLFSGHTKAFQIISEVVAELVGFCEECFVFSGRGAVKIRLLASYTSSCLAVMSV